MLRIVALLAPLLLLSGCCRVFGICTSVDVQTSIQRQEKFPQPPYSDVALNSLYANSSGSSAASCGMVAAK
jgi:hypothetical protein